MNFIESMIARIHPLPDEKPAAPPPAPAQVPPAAPLPIPTVAPVAPAPTPTLEASHLNVTDLSITSGAIDPSDPKALGYPPSFTVAINRVLTLEGGYVNDPNDPGGETNWGISKRSYPNVDIKRLTRDGAIAIYFRDFWTKVNAGRMAPPLAYQALDFAVNSGIDIAIRKLQVAVGVADDGYWGPNTQAAIAQMTPTDVLFRFIAERLDFMARLSNFSSAGRGWARRIASNLRYAAVDA